MVGRLVIGECWIGWWWHCLTCTWSTFKQTPGAPARGCSCTTPYVVVGKTVS